MLLILITNIFATTRKATNRNAGSECFGGQMPQNYMIAKWLGGGMLRTNPCDQPLHVSTTGDLDPRGYSHIIAIRVHVPANRVVFLGLCLKRSILLKPFSRTGYNFSNARKPQNIIRDFNNRTGY